MANKIEIANYFFENNKVGQLFTKLDNLPEGKGLGSAAHYRLRNASIEISSLMKAYDETKVALFQKYMLNAEDHKKFIEGRIPSSEFMPDFGDNKEKVDSEFKELLSVVNTLSTPQLPVPKTWFDEQPIQGRQYQELLEILFDYSVFAEDDGDIDEG